MNKIEVLKPTVSSKTATDVYTVLQSGWLGCGPKVKEFEEEFAKYVDKKYAVATSSATAGLDLVLRAYKIRGGELITTALTFVSDAIVGEWNDMKVRFSDIDEDSLCLDPDKLKVNKTTEAIIVVNSHGRLADIDGIRKKARGALIIEDCAHAMYTPGVGKGDIQVYSFQAVKTLPIGDGGMITTDDKKIYDRLNKIKWLNVEKTTYERTQGKTYSWDYSITDGDGIKAYMGDVQATIGLGQLKRLDEMLAKRRAIQTKYNSVFISSRYIQAPDYSHTVQYYTMKCKNRDKLSDYLAKQGIVTSVHFKPLNKMKYWAKAEVEPLTVTNRVWLQLLSLPCHDALTWVEVEYIIDHVLKFYE